jgi:putative copper export protein
MDNISLAISGLMMVAMIIWIAPNILRLNQGKILRNTALWVAIFLLLGLAYRVVGPGRYEDQSTKTEQTINQTESAPPAPQKDNMGSIEPRI